MLVVPIYKDLISTKDGLKYRVIEYTNYKDGGPAVYARSKGSKEISLIYFFDIAEINGTPVEYNKSSKIFTALGKVHRLQHLPQPDDNVTIITDKSDLENSRKTIDVQSLKLRSKSVGINKGMVIKDEENNYFRLKQVIDIERSLGSSNFNREEFLTLYKDYLGV